MPDLRAGAELFNRGEFWEAHEAWEREWNEAAAAGDAAATACAQGLIQVAAAFLKRRQGEESGAGRLLARARVHLAVAVAAGGPIVLGVDLEGWVPAAAAAFNAGEKTPPPLEVSGHTGAA